MIKTEQQPESLINKINSLNRESNISLKLPRNSRDRRDRYARFAENPLPEESPSNSPENLVVETLEIPMSIAKDIEDSVIISGLTLERASNYVDAIFKRFPELLAGYNQKQEELTSLVTQDSSVLDISLKKGWDVPSSVLSSKLSLLEINEEALRQEKERIEKEEKECIEKEEKECIENEEKECIEKDDKRLLEEKKSFFKTLRSDFWNVVPEILKVKTPCTWHHHHSGVGCWNKEGKISIGEGDNEIVFACSKGYHDISSNDSRPGFCTCFNKSKICKKPFHLAHIKLCKNFDIETGTDNCKQPYCLRGHLNNAPHTQSQPVVHESRLEYSKRISPYLREVLDNVFKSTGVEVSTITQCSYENCSKLNDEKHCRDYYHGKTVLSDIPCPLSIEHVSCAFKCTKSPNTMIKSKTPMSKESSTLSTSESITPISKESSTLSTSVSTFSTQPPKVLRKHSPYDYCMSKRGDKRFELFFKVISDLESSGKIISSITQCSYKVCNMRGSIQHCADYCHEDTNVLSEIPCPLIHKHSSCAFRCVHKAPYTKP
jgi:hypothetical protein